MPIAMDPEIQDVLVAAMAAAGDTPAPPARGDALALRTLTNATLQFVDEGEPDSPDVEIADYFVSLEDGTEMLVRWYSKNGSVPGSAVVYLHGGGMICASVTIYDGLVSHYVQESGVPFLSVDYRIAPEHRGTSLVDDGYAAVRWFLERADEFGISADRVAIMGDSGGGGIAAGVAIAARDGGTTLAKQILIYPMLDDRTLEPDPEIAPYATWTYDNNYTGWNALLGDELGTASVSVLAAPSRLTDFHGLAPAFIVVGELDIFRDEDILYALDLQRAGVSTELHVQPGAPHAFDRLAPHSAVAQRTWSDIVRVIESI